MIKVFFIVLVVLAACPAVRAGQDLTMVLQDENFFLQDENKKLKAELADKDAAIRRLAEGKDVFEKKVIDLQRALLECDADLPRRAEQAALPYRAQMEDAVKQLKVMAMTIDEKNTRLTGLLKDKEALQAQLEVLTGEKMSLRASLQKAADEVAAVRSGVDEKVAEERASGEARLKDMQVRLAAEQTLAQEKIAQEKKPLEAEIAMLREKVRKLEEQIAALRESAGLEIKKVRDDSAAQIRKLNEQLKAAGK